MHDPPVRDDRSQPPAAPARAVIFDLGGVVLGSPLHAIAAFERAHGLPEGLVNRVVVAGAPDGAWSRLERGELAMDEFYDAFGRECAAAGHRVEARALFAAMGEAAQPRPRMIAALGRLRSAGLRLAALTNNWASDEAGAEDGTRALAAHFDVFVESVVEGLRKPDPRIYELVCHRLRVAPHQAIFLDDIGANLKPARAMGMTTIRVTDPDEALEQLSRAVGVDLD